MIFVTLFNEYHRFIIKNTKTKPSEKTMVLIYQQIGKISYKIAAVDKTIRPEEIKEFKKNGCLFKILMTHLDLIPHTK